MFLELIILNKASFTHKFFLKEKQLSHSLLSYLYRLKQINFKLYIDNIDFIPEEYPDIAEKLPAIKESVKNALANPFEITESKDHKTN